MSSILHLCAFLPGILLVSWFLLRLGMFLSDRVGSTSPSPGTFRLARLLHRAALITLSAEAAVGLAFMVFLVRAFSPNDTALFTTGAALALYFLLAFILNFPGFPLRLHALVFIPCQFLLLGSLISLVALDLQAWVLALPALLFFFFWLLDLHARLHLPSPADP